LGQVDDRGDVGHPVAKRWHVVAVDHGPGVEGALAAGLVPLDLLAPALRAEGPGVVGVGIAVEAVLDQEAALLGGVPEFDGVALRGGEVETDCAHVASSLGRSRIDPQERIGHAATNLTLASTFAPT